MLTELHGRGTSHRVSVAEATGAAVWVVSSEVKGSRLAAVAQGSLHIAFTGTISIEWIADTDTTIRAARTLSAPSLGERVIARLALVTLLSCHGRFANAVSVLVTLQTQ